MQEKKRKELVEELMDKMFEIAGHDLKWEDMKERQDPWYDQYTWSKEQEEEWRSWGINLLRKKAGMNIAMATRNVNGLLFQTGLKVV